MLREFYDVVLKNWSMEAFISQENYAELNGGNFDFNANRKHKNVK